MNSTAVILNRYKITNTFFDDLWRRPNDAKENEWHKASVLFVVEWRISAREQETVFGSID